MTREVEVKLSIPCSELDSIRANVVERGGEVRDVSEELDIYLVHPCRDLKATDEAVRVRYVNGHPKSLTYKGPRLPGDVKQREEIIVEVKDDPLPVLEALGFSRGVAVQKSRIYIDYKDVELALDVVEGLGCFVEVESKVGDADSVKRALEELEIRGSVVQKTYAELILERTAAGERR